MFPRQVPANTVLIDAQSVSGREMPSEHQAAPAALQANDIIVMNGSTDRHRGCPLSLGFGCRFSELGNRLMDSRDQGRELVGPNLVSPNVSCDYIGREFSVACS